MDIFGDLIFYVVILVILLAVLGSAIKILRD